MPPVNPIVGSEPSVVMRFTSDGSVTSGPGFEATITCAAAPPSECTNTDIMVDWAGGFHASGHAQFGGQTLTVVDFDNVQVVVADPVVGCDPFTNAAAMPGKIALIQRGACTFVSKVLNAQNAGAVAAIIWNHSPGMVTMAGDNADITIPAVFLSQEDGDAMSAAVAAYPATTASLHCAGESFHGAVDPCAGAGVVLLDSGDVSLGNMVNHQMCAWTMVCTAADLAPLLTFTEFQTEGGWDFLYLYDADNTDGAADATLHGSSLPDPIQFTSQARFLVG
jgi:hypothetical protein